MEDNDAIISTTIQVASAGGGKKTKLEKHSTYDP